MSVSFERSGTPVVVDGLLEVLETLLGSLKGQNYFYNNNNKTLLTVFTVFVLMMQNLQWVKLLVL